MNRTDFDLRDPLKPGDLLDATRKIMRAVRALMPLDTPSVTANMQLDGTRYTAKPGGAASPLAVIEVTLQNDYWPVLLGTDAAATEYTIYSPIGLEWSGGSGAQGIWRPKRNSGGEAVGYNWHDTGDASHGHSNRFRRDFPIAGGSDVVREALTPGYREGESYLYIMPLIVPVSVEPVNGGDTYTCTHIDLNLAGRQWIPFRADGRWDAPLTDTDETP